MLTGGQEHDAPAGRELLERIGRTRETIPLMMDKAYEGYETRYTAAMLGYNAVVPPKANRKEPWGYDKDLYKLRNEVERFFRRYDRFRRLFTRYDKLDVMFLLYLTLAFIHDILH